MSKLLPVPFRRQLTRGYCLPACAEMILAYLGFNISQKQIAQMMGASEEGVPFSRVNAIESLGVRVRLSKEGDWDVLQDAFRQEQPSLVAVDLVFFPYAQVDESHVVVVVGINDDEVSVLDPFEDPGLRHIKKDAFIAAWTELDCAYAVITKA